MNVELPVGLIGPGPSVRADRLDLDHVSALRQVLDDLPPIVVRAEGDRYRLVDGTHRLAAHRFEGRETIRAERVDLDGEAEVFEAAARANRTHGKPLSVAERKSVARRLVALAPEWSNVRIAEAVGLSDKTVGELRPRPTSRPTSESPRLDTPAPVAPPTPTPAPAPARTEGRDGKARPATAADREAQRERIAEKVAAEPDAPLREVARATGASPSTVAKVRDEVRTGRPRLAPVPDPEPTAEPAEPTIGDLVPMVSMPWVRDERCQTSNAARDFARAMDRHTGKALKGVEEAITDGCPPGDVARVAASTARDVAAMWTRIADALARPRQLREA